MKVTTSPSSAKVMNVSSYFSTPQHVFMTQRLINYHIFAFSQQEEVMLLLSVCDVQGEFFLAQS
jgi:hypothetical protein